MHRLGTFAGSRRFSAAVLILTTPQCLGLMLAVDIA
jgi:hypothetical protein